MDAPLRDHQLRRAGRLHPLPDGAAVDGVREGYIGADLPRHHRPGLARRSAWTGSTWSCRASATRSPRCRRCTPASRSWSRCTASGGCARRCAGCWCSIRWRCRRRWSTTPSTTSSTSSPGCVLAAVVMVGVGAWERRRAPSSALATAALDPAHRLIPASTACWSIAASSSAVSSGNAARRGWCPAARPTTPADHRGLR